MTYGGWMVDGALRRPAPGDIVRINRGGQGGVPRGTAPGMEWHVVEFAEDRNRVRVDLVRGSILGPQWENWADLEFVREG